MVGAFSYDIIKGEDFCYEREFREKTRKGREKKEN